MCVNACASVRTCSHDMNATFYCKVTGTVVVVLLLLLLLLLMLFIKSLCMLFCCCQVVVIVVVVVAVVNVFSQYPWRNIVLEEPLASAKHGPDCVKAYSGQILR